MAQYLRPGAYIERTDAAQTDRLLLRSDVPGFIGIAEKGPLDTPVPIESFRQFQAYFGEFIAGGFLAYSVRAFFDNGGRRCWIVRVASRSFENSAGLAACSASTLISDQSHQDIWSIKAFSEGSWGNSLQIAMLEENHADASIAAGHISESYAQVSSTAGFVRGTLVRISQEHSSASLHEYTRVISFIDEIKQRLYWVHPEPGMGLSYDEKLSGFDVNQPARITSISYRLDVYNQHRLLKIYSGLSLIPEHENYAPVKLASKTDYREAVNTQRMQDVPEPVIITALQNHINKIPVPLAIQPLLKITLTQGQDGLNQLRHTDFIGEDFSVYDTDQQRLQKRRGLSALSQLNDITLLAVPDIVIKPQTENEYQAEIPEPQNPCIDCPPPSEPAQLFTPAEKSYETPPEFSLQQIYQVQAAMVTICEKRGDCFAVIDSPYSIANSEESGLADIRAWRSRFDSDYAALYYPWIKVIDPRNSDIRIIPPSGHVLGQYALHDNETGVHRAPANRSINWIQDLSLHTNFAQQELLNPLAINVLRSEGPRGIRIMGARTMSSDTDWTYINIRRLLIMIRRALDIISQWVVFEPNHALTRNKFQLAISSYLSALWLRGALSGTSREQAFFVKCDEENNPSQQRGNGQLIAEIGVAPSHPFEFVIMRVGMQENELKITESGGAASAA